MPDTESYDILIVGAGEAGKWLAWTNGSRGPSHRGRGAKADRRVLPERRNSGRSWSHR